jgi:deoxyribonuclease V
VGGLIFVRGEITISKMPTVWIRAYEELNDFLPEENRKRTFAHSLPEGATVAQLLTDLGIPSSKVDLVLAGDVSVGLTHRIRDGGRISVYPVFERLDVAGVTELRGEPLRSPRFFAGRSLEPLAAHLRLLGFDTEVSEDPVDGLNLRRAEAEHRILLTRDRHPGRDAISRALLLNENNPGGQLREVLSRLDLYRSAARHSWQVTADQAMEIQRQLREEVVARDEIGPVNLIGGVDVAFDEEETAASAAVAVLSFPELELCDSAVARLPLRFRYVPGLLSFRETPAVLEAIAGLQRAPDLLFCDGHGYAHPRRFGMACHVGILTGIPAIGVAKSILTGRHGELPSERGAWAPLLDGDETIGAAVRTRVGVKPVYVSVGNRISLATAIDYVVRCSRYRLPEPSRWADRLSRTSEEEEKKNGRTKRIKQRQL